MGTLKSELEFEHLLEDVGDFGKYQKRLIIFFLIPSAALLPWFTMNILFLVFTPDHWCNVPEVAASNLSIEIQRNIIAPLDKSSCYRYDLNYTDFLKTGSFHVKNDTPLVECDNGWQYDTTHFQETAASKWNMVCKDEHYPSFVMTLTNVGSIFGTPIYGTLSDKIGRKPVFFIVILVTAMTAISSILMTDFTAFLVLRTINGSLMPSVFQLPFIILQRTPHETKALRKGLTPDEIANLLRELSERMNWGSNLDSNEDIRLSESNCEESGESQM
ncbi:carcinine transporter [Trichonephila clavipes]|nr:carcinine transporter [Trichonephila clavipes]